MNIRRNLKNIKRMMHYLKRTGRCEKKKNEDLENPYINAMKYTMHTISKRNYLLHPSTLLPFTVFIQFP